MGRTFTVRPLFWIAAVGATPSCDADCVAMGGDPSIAAVWSRLRRVLVIEEARSPMCMAGRGTGRACVVIEGHGVAVHGQCRAGLAAELRDGAGRRSRPWRAAPARGTCRGVRASAAVGCDHARQSVRVRSSGPPISSVWPRVSGSMTARSTSAATSSTETKLIGFCPRPKTSGRFERPGGAPHQIDPQLEEGGGAHDGGRTPRWRPAPSRPSASSGTTPTDCPVPHRRPT